MSTRQVVVVTGARAGVGRGTARRFAERGAAVALLARGEKGLAGAAEEVRAAVGTALVVPVDMDEHRIGAHHVADGRQQPVTGALWQILGPLLQQRSLVPHQLAAPDPVGGAPHGADVVAPDLGGGQIRLALDQRVEQSQDRPVGDVGEPFPRLRRHAGLRQVLEELLRLARHPGGPQRLDQQGAAAALGCEDQVRGGVVRHA